MNRTVEHGKTLLVDGPASVSMISGKAVAYGFNVDSRKIVVREGKRIPFAVKETATFDISLGEAANIKEINGDSIPSSWLKAFEIKWSHQIEPFVAMILGAIDAGKTSFCTFMLNKLLSEEQSVTILDGDVGQSDIGPPCTISYTSVTEPVIDLSSLKARDAFFVGSTSPDRVVTKMAEGFDLLKQRILSSNPDSIIINTDGWIEGEKAIEYKLQLVEKLNPDIVFCIQKKDELASLLAALGRFRNIVVDSPLVIRQRSQEERRSFRELGYKKYLRKARVRSIPLSWLRIKENGLIGLSRNQGNIKQTREIYGLIGMKPLNIAEVRDKICIVVGRGRWINLEDIKKVEKITNREVEVMHKGEEEGLLVALYDAKANFLGIGCLREIDYKREVIKIYTPVLEKISVVEVGKIKLDENLKETSIPANNQSDSSMQATTSNLPD